MKYHYRYPERLACIPKPDLDAVNGNIVIYGTEKTSLVTACALEQQRLSFLCFVDSDKRKQGNIYENHPVISLQELTKRYPYALVLVASSSYREIMLALLESGLTKEQIFPCSHVIEGVTLSGMELSDERQIHALEKYNHSCFLFFNRGEQRIIHELAILPTTKCTLKCKECTYRIPYITEHKVCDVIQIKNAVTKLLDFNYKIDTITVIGGEPLLYRDLPDLIHTLCSFENVDNVTIVTNGTISINKELYNTLIENRKKVIVRISNYGELSPKAEEIEKLLTEKGIRVGNMRQGNWFETVPLKELKLTDYEIQKFFILCPCRFKVCGILYFYDGKFLPCVKSIVLDNMSIGQSDTDSIQYNDPDFKTKIKKLFEDNTFYNTCRYCTKFTQANRIKIPVAEQLS